MSKNFIPRLIKRTFDQQTYQSALKYGIQKLSARVFASRIQIKGNIEPWFDMSLKSLDAPWGLIDIKIATSRLAQAIIKQEIIAIETDHDCDGQTSHAVIYEALKQFRHPTNKIQSYIGHRLEEGYGLSEKLADRILNNNPRPHCLITADNGSTDELRIAKLKMEGIEIIVTDHHQIPSEGPPKSAIACVNPTRTDSHYSDPMIAGCMVAWLLMTALRAELIKIGYLAQNAPKLTSLLDFVAVGTIADCVSMSQSLNNRVVTYFGLKLMNQSKRPCWKVLRNKIGCSFDAQNIAFQVAPLLNSDGRLATAMQSVSFLLAENIESANKWVVVLYKQNQQRRQIQNNITQEGIINATAQVNNGDRSLRVFLANGHPGIHGISASHCKDIFGRPTVFLAPKQNTENLVTGSLRGIPGFHIKRSLDILAKRFPKMFLAYGGHEGAGGLTLEKNQLNTFISAFEDIAIEQLNIEDIGPRIWTDGNLNFDSLNQDIFESLEKLAPYGREFDLPLFESYAVIELLKWVGDGTHLKLILKQDQKKCSAIWFGARSSINTNICLNVGDTIKMVYAMQWNHYRSCIDVRVETAHKV